MSVNSYTEGFSWRKAAMLCLGVGLLTAGLSLTWQSKNHVALKFDGGLFKPKAEAAAIGVGSPFKAPDGYPVELMIPSIGVDAKIQSVGLAWNSEMGIPSNFTDVGWYNRGPIPGQIGSAVIDGHLDGRNTPEAVFYNIKKLELGDLVEVAIKGGKTLDFIVTGSKTYDYDASTTDVFSSSDSKPHLNLITCAGDWIPDQKVYNERIVVFTDLMAN